MNHNPVQSSGSSGECHVCHGSGWELYEAKVPELYGEQISIEFARPCSKCTGVRRTKDRTGVPDTFHEADLYKFNFEAYSVDLSKMKALVMSMFQNFGKWKDNGKGLYLWSETPGSGKTFLACCLAKSIMLRYDLQMRFVTAPDYLAAVAESYKQERGFSDPSAVYRKCRLLILDDIGTQMEREWQNQELFKLINQRMTDGLVTIYTSNLPIERLNVDDRIKDRIIKTSVVLQMPEESIRRKQAKREQDSFLEQILGGVG